MFLCDSFHCIRFMTKLIRWLANSSFQARRKSWFIYILQTHQAKNQLTSFKAGKLVFNLVNGWSAIVTWAVTYYTVNTSSCVGLSVYPWWLNKVISYYIIVRSENQLYACVSLQRSILPPCLYLQLDNTARENKNQYVMAFLAYLVQAGVFSEVSFIVLCTLHVMCA